MLLMYCKRRLWKCKDDSHVGCECWTRLKTGAEEDGHKLSDGLHGRGENVAQITENRMIENNLKSKPVKIVISNR